MRQRSFVAIIVLACGCADSGAQESAPTYLDAGTSLLGPSDPDAKAPEMSILGAWAGYVENYQFPSGSDSLRFTIASDANGVLLGTVVLGDGLPPPPATDAARGYPPNLDSSYGFDASSYWHEGFAYTMVRGSATGTRIQFTIESLELWAGWCALQTSPDGLGMCLPSWGGTITPDGHCSQTSPTTGQVVEVDCGKLNLCTGARVCQCTATSCTVEPAMEATMAFDMTFSGNSASGSIASSSIGRANLHFVHDQE